MKKIGLFGGTFDPIHNGHWAIAFSAFKHLKLNQVLFIPCGIPSHRATPYAKNYQRLKMLRLALKNNTFFKICDFELKKKTPSFTIETLEYLRLFYSIRETEFFWIIGSDSFNQIHTWKNFQQLFDLTHFIVFERSCFPILKPENFKTFEKEKSGQIFTLSHFPKDISSTQIRENYKNNFTNNKNHSFLNKNVLEYILKNKIYF